MFESTVQAILAIHSQEIGRCALCSNGSSAVLNNGDCQNPEPFQGAHFLQYLRIQLFRKHFVRIAAIFRRTCHHVGNHQPFKILLIFQRVLHAQNATP